MPWKRCRPVNERAWKSERVGWVFGTISATGSSVPHEHTIDLSVTGQASPPPLTRRCWPLTKPRGRLPRLPLELRDGPVRRQLVHGLGQHLRELLRQILD